MQVIYVCDVGASRLLDTLPGKYAFKSPLQCTAFALSQVKAFEKGQKVTKQIYSDAGGFNYVKVDKFDKQAVAGFVDKLPIHSKIVLNCTTEMMDTLEVSIDKTYLM